MVVRRRERLVGVREHRTGRRDVEHGELRHGVRMIEAQPMRNASAAVVSYEPELANGRESRINSTMSAAIARFEYAACVASDAGLPESP